MQHHSLDSYGGNEMVQQQCHAWCIGSNVSAAIIFIHVCIPLHHILHKDQMFYILVCIHLVAYLCHTISIYLVWKLVRDQHFMLPNVLKLIYCSYGYA
jgi:hypothetical protein